MCVMVMAGRTFFLVDEFCRSCVWKYFRPSSSLNEIKGERMRRVTSNAERRGDDEDTYFLIVEGLVACEGAAPKHLKGWGCFV